MTLRDEIAETEAKLAELKRRAATATCAEIGHDWYTSGGAQAGCSQFCSCSVPVHHCRRCKECDYGYNPEAEAVRQRCPAGSL